MYESYKARWIGFNLQVVGSILTLGLVHATMSWFLDGHWKFNVIQSLCFFFHSESIHKEEHEWYYENIHLIMLLSCLKSFTGCSLHFTLKQNCEVVFKACSHLGTADLFTFAACSSPSSRTSLNFISLNDKLCPNTGSSHKFLSARNYHHPSSFIFRDSESLLLDLSWPSQ